MIYLCYAIFCQIGRIGSMFVDCYMYFQPCYRKVKPKTIIKLLFVASLLSLQYQGEGAKTGLLGIRIMCPNEVTCQLI